MDLLIGVVLMENNQEGILLTSAEQSYLWTTYQADTMAVCVFNHFLQHIKDNEIKSLIVFALQLSEEHANFIREIFIKEKIQIPQGFTESDVNLHAERLFSDVFYLNYIKNMAKGGLVTYGRVLQNVYRKDILSFFSACLSQSIELNSRAIDISLKKGLAIRPPTIPYLEKLEFVHKQSFILEGLGRREALTGTEVTNLFANIQTNYIGTSLATAFSQVCKTKKAQNFFKRGKEIALKHIEIFSSYLKMSSLPVPGTYEQMVTQSKDSPYSDKLMMFHFSLMIYSGVGNYGLSTAETQRSDLVADYTRLNAEILKYSEDGANIMIAEKWLEQPPLAANRRDLAKG